MILSITIDMMLVHFLSALDGDTGELFGFLVTVGVVVYDDITVDIALLLPRQCLTINHTGSPGHLVTQTHSPIT